MSKEQVERQAPFGSPKEVYLGIFTSADAVRNVLVALSSKGLPRATRVLAGQEGKEAFNDVSLERVGADSGGTLIRQILAGDELETEKRYRDAIKKGSYVLQVPVPQDDSAAREGVETEMLGSGGRYIHYFGTLTFEEVVANRDHDHS